VQRWACEQVLSAIKGIFGDHMMARRENLIVAEILIKVALYDVLLMDGAFNDLGGVLPPQSSNWPRIISQAKSP
jgi:hypothetical protein